MTQVVPLYPDLFPKGVPADKREESIDVRGIINNIHNPTLTIYRPYAPMSSGAGVIVCPGGGYGVLAIDHEGEQIARWLCTIGVTAFVLKYRLPPHYPHPTPLQDAQRAIRLVRSCAESWGVKADRIGILGFSAGGHLASTAATHFDAGKVDSPEAAERQNCRPDFAVLCYPVICFSKPYCHTGSRSSLIGSNASRELVDSLSSELQVSAHTPPTFVFHSQDDKSVDPRNSIEFYLACLAHGVPAEMHLFPSGGHGYGMGNRGTSESQWPDLCARWMAHIGMIERRA